MPAIQRGRTGRRAAMAIEFTVNGARASADSSRGGDSLLSYLRDELELKGSKNGCGDGHCGACTVVVDGKAVLACKTPLSSLPGKSVSTIESMSDGGSVHAIVYAFAKAGAVQCGFCTPGFVMSTKALLDANPDPSELEIRRALTKNVCRCTGYQSILDAVRLAASLLREGRDWIQREGVLPDRPGRIGESLVRIDALDKAAGMTRYADDLEFPGMLHAKVVRSARPHADILSIGVSEAEGSPGVVRVLLAKDVPGENHYGPIKKDQPVLADDRVRYSGDAIAAVYAESESEAEAAVSKVSVEYRDLPILTGYDEALAPGAPELHEGSGNVIATMSAGRGDAEAGLDAAALVVEGDYSTQYIEHAYLEPESCVALKEPDGSLSVYVASQGPPMDRAEIAHALAIPEDRIRIVGTPMGGGFGGKEDISVQIIAALGALATGRPVKYTFTRWESIRVSGKRHATRMLYETGVDAEGRLTAVRARIQARGGAYASVEEAVILRSSSFAAGPYTVPAADIEAKAVYQTHAPACAMRGFGNPVVTFGSETSMNRIAEELGLDPIELRLRNALEAGKPTLTGDRPTTSVGVKECLLSIREALSKYRQPDPPDGWAAGIGVACSYKNVGLGIGMDDSAGASAELREDGTILLRVGAVDMGQGSNSAMAQLLSARLGWPFSRIEVHSADTGLDPLAGMTTASRQTFVSGNATLRAADALLAEISAFACRELGLPQAALEFKDGTLVSKGDGKPLMSIPELAARVRATGARLAGTARWSAPATKFSLREPPGGYEKAADGKLHAAYCFAAQATALEVHRATGRVVVKDVFIAADVGSAINRAAVEGQMRGGVVMGLGYALTEEYREEAGLPATDTLGRLGLWRIGQMPRIECLLVENPHDDGPFGAKGMGELPISMGPPSVAHAVHKALGGWVYSLPITPDKILKAAAGS